MPKVRLFLEEEALHIIICATLGTSDVSSTLGLFMLLYSRLVKLKYVASVS